MRNLFDQYTQPENKLSHALATVLAEDPSLLKAFISWSGASHPRTLKGLRVLEQARPGELPREDSHTETTGLPDLWIYNDDEWSLLVESKVQAKASRRQIRAHFNSADRLGYQAHVLLLTPGQPRFSLPDAVTHRQWTDLYVWLSRQPDESGWAATLLDYMETLERKWAAGGYLEEGTLTEFAGIKTDPDEAWNYRESKRQLKLLMEELRKRKTLSSRLRLDLEALGRPAITDGGGVVWDLLRVKPSIDATHHTAYPHFSVVIGQSSLIAHINIPDSIRTAFRRRLLGDDYDHFLTVMRKSNQGIKRALRRLDGARPILIFLQRRYRSQRSVPFVDAELKFDMRTVFPIGRKARGQVRSQAQWLELVYDILCNKNSNLHVSVGADFDMRTCAAVRSRDIIEVIENVWLGCKPILDAMEIDEPYSR